MLLIRRVFGRGREGELLWPSHVIMRLFVSLCGVCAPPAFLCAVCWELRAPWLFTGMCFIAQGRVLRLLAEWGWFELRRVSIV